MAYEKDFEPDMTFLLNIGRCYIRSASVSVFFVTTGGL
jgi:hypothetical protein